jgi:TIR domain
MAAKPLVTNAATIGDNGRQPTVASPSKHVAKHLAHGHRGQKGRQQKRLARSAQRADKNAPQPTRRAAAAAGQVRSQNGKDYLFDFFISYKRDAETRSWIEKHFRPLLNLRVRQEIGRDPRIFIDDQLETGASWPLQLGESLGRSRILIALWSKDYFSSSWCVLEMSQMLAREEQSNMRGVGNSRGLVIPVVIHDGEEFPNSLCDIQRIDIQSCFNVRMAVDSRRAEDLDAILAREARAFAKALECAPNWQEHWTTTAAREFYNQHFQSIPVEQRRLPRFTD